MPGLNQTGPLGQGPMTGRRMGRCNASGADLKNQESDTNNHPNDNLPENFYGKGRGMDLRCGRRGKGFGTGRQNQFRGGH